MTEMEQDAAICAINAMSNAMNDIGHAIADGHVDPERHGELLFAATELSKASAKLIQAFRLGKAENHPRQETSD